MDDFDRLDLKAVVPVDPVLKSSLLLAEVWGLSSSITLICASFFDVESLEDDLDVPNVFASARLNPALSSRTVCIGGKAILLSPLASLRGALSFDPSKFSATLFMRISCCNLSLRISCSSSSRNVLRTFLVGLVGLDIRDFGCQTQHHLPISMGDTCLAFLNLDNSHSGRTSGPSCK